ncbi:MAG TPA: histidine kinase [Flavisolibacter sp.]|nr:histidine kinase [Flavisolibacter sp.]
MLKHKKRYSFWKVFWVVLGLNLIFTILGFIALSVSPMYSKDFNWNKLFTWHYLLSQLISISFSSAFYFFAVNSYYSFFYERRPASDYVKPTVIAVVALAGYFAFTYFLAISKKITVSINNSKIEQELTPALMVFSYIISSVFFIGMALLIAYLTHLRDERKQRKILEEQKMQLEVEKSQANFNFLKAQINPHFLHNTLNFLYAKSLPYSPELSEGILTLSDIMRYALSEGNAKDGKAPLKDEIEHVRNVIKINQLRFSNKLNVKFNVEGVVNGATIIPFVLITLVENAFKHGDLKSTEYPIDIILKINDSQLYFYCRNKKKIGPKELSTGIGLDNIKKRLDLAYGNNYCLKVKDESDFYTTELTISKL